MEEKIIIGEQDIKVGLIDSFPNHPYHVFDDTDVFPSFSQTVRMRKAFNNGELTYKLIVKIMAEDKANQKPKYRFPAEKINQYLPANMNDKQAEQYVLKALSYYQKYLERKNPK